MAEDGVRTGRLPVVAVGASELVVDGGVKSGVVSVSGAWAGDVGSVTEEADQQNKLLVRIMVIWLNLLFINSLIFWNS